MRVILIRNAGYGKGYIDKRLFGQMHFHWVESIRYGDLKYIDADYRNYLLNYPNIMHHLRNPDSRLYDLLINTSETETTPQIDTDTNVIISVNRLAFAPLALPSIIIYPIERLSTMMGRALYQYAAKGGHVPPIHNYFDAELKDQNILAHLIQEGKHKIILYDNVKNEVISDLSAYLPAILSHNLRMIAYESICNHLTSRLASLGSTNLASCALQLTIGFFICFFPLIISSFELI